MHEMNGSWYPWGGTANENSAHDYVRAWRRLHGIFARVGAANVRWVWSPLVEDVPATPGNAFERYYPGSRYVDVLALDGYNWGTSVPGFGGWRSFDAVFASAYARIVRLGSQPVWIAETASDVGRGRQGRMGARPVRGSVALPEDRRRGLVPRPQGARLACHELAGGSGSVQGVERGASSVSGCPQWREPP